MKKSIEDDLGKKLDEVFGSFDPEALAAASIAQVHRCVTAVFPLLPSLAHETWVFYSRATLKDGTPVAVKVQHSDMSRLLSQDLDNLNHLLSWMALLEPGTSAPYFVQPQSHCCHRVRSQGSVGRMVEGDDEGARFSP